MQFPSLAYTKVEQETGIYMITEAKWLYLRVARYTGVTLMMRVNKHAMLNE